jgi:hypothetical protein
MFLKVALLVSILLVLYWYFYLYTEAYRSCRGCDDYRMPRNGVAVLNPFIWPYSGTSCVDDLYILNKDSGVNLNFSEAPLTHLSTPDHVELI